MPCRPNFNMNWKKLLQPTIGKFALAALFFITFVPFIEFDTGIRCITVPCPSSSVGSILSYHLFYFQHSYVRPHIYHLHEREETVAPAPLEILYINIVLGSLFSYFAACALASFRSKPAKNAR
jgi:hypothetical protein